MTLDKNDIQERYTRCDTVCHKTIWEIPSLLDGREVIENLLGGKYSWTTDIESEVQESATFDWAFDEAAPNEDYTLNSDSASAEV